MINDNIMENDEYWSGGAGKPASGMRISCARSGAGWAGLSSVCNGVQLKISIFSKIECS